MSRKTIFITIFEGVESKNILRTDIGKTILSRKDLRAVLLVKNEARRDHHVAEFGTNDRVMYEVVPPQPLYGIDKLFMYIKFVLLRTASTRLMRKIALELRGSYVLYFWGEAINIIFAHPFFVRIFRWLDRVLVRRTQFDTLFDKYSPDLIFVANLFDEHEATLVREANRRKIRSIAIINSWDRVTARSVIRVVPEKIIAYNNTVRDALVRFQDISFQRIIVGGVPHYDYHFKAPYVHREDFFKNLSIPFDKKILVYAPLGNEYSDSDWDMLDLLGKWNREGEFGEVVQILVRIPPNDYVNTLEMKKRPDFIYDYPGKRFSPKKGIDWDMTTDELRHLSDTLYHMSVLVCYATSISVEAAIIDRPVININFDVGVKKETLLRSPTHYYKKHHYQEALNTKGIRLVGTKTELIESIKLYLKNPTIDQKERHVLALQQCVFLDGASGRRIARSILDMLPK